MKNTRRLFIKAGAAAAANTFVLPRFSIGKPGPSANSKLNIAMIGTSGIGTGAFRACEAENIVAMCDIDSSKCPKEHFGTPSFSDFRVMLDNMGNQGHTGDGIRTMREWYEAGVFGQVSEVHMGHEGPTCGSRYFQKPASVPPSKQPLPSTVDWDLWLGPARLTEYNEIFHPRCSPRFQRKQSMRFFFLWQPFFLEWSKRHHCVR